MPAPDGTSEIVAAILTMVRLQKHPVPGGSSLPEAFVEEYRLMLEAVKKADQP